MKAIKLLSLFAVVALLASCGGNNLTTHVSDDTEYAKPSEAGFYGEPFDIGEKPASLKQINAAIDKYDGYEGVVAGTVNDVCVKKGCWMNLTTSEGQDMFVRFKDYAFFVPRDIQEYEVRMNGVAYMDTTSVDELRHYAEDAGEPEEVIMAITEPEVIMKFEATGVAVLEK